LGEIVANALIEKKTTCTAGDKNEGTGQRLEESGRFFKGKGIERERSFA